MDLTPCPILTLPLKLPVRVRLVEGTPKLIAGGIPVTPINLVLQERQTHEGATQASIATYLRAARLFVEYCAYRHQSLVGISNEEFIWFMDALLGQSFPDAQGNQVQFSGKRGRRTADLMITLLYFLTAGITERYRGSFDWRRYKGAPYQLTDSRCNSANLSRSRSWSFRRSHRIKWPSPKVVGLPDDQFVRLLHAAYERWGNAIADGDIAFAEEPEMQRGASFYRNLAVLVVLRCAGNRRSEVEQLRFDDIDRANSLIFLTTKGHRKGENRSYRCSQFNRVPCGYCGLLQGPAACEDYLNCTTAEDGGCRWFLTDPGNAGMLIQITQTAGRYRQQEQDSATAGRVVQAGKYAVLAHCAETVEQEALSHCDIDTLPDCSQDIKERLKARRHKIDEKGL